MQHLQNQIDAYADAVARRGVLTILDSLVREVDAARALVSVSPDALTWPQRVEVIEALSLVRSLLADAAAHAVDAQVAIEAARQAATP